MREYCENLQARWPSASGKLSDLTLEFLAFAEGRFLTAHPFADFNGRTIRLFLRELLRRLDLPFVRLEPEDNWERQDYYHDLEEAGQLRWALLVDIWRKRLSI